MLLDARGIGTDSARERSHAFEMGDTGTATTSMNTSPGVTRTVSREEGGRRQTGLLDGSETTGIARHTLGLLLLLCVVFLWTLSNFLGSSIFADNTYAKPFFLTYLNTSTFMLALIPSLARSGWQLHREGEIWEVLASIRSRWRTGGVRRLLKHEDDGRHDRDGEGAAFLKPVDADADTEAEEREQDDDFGHDRHSNRASSRRRKRKHLGLVPTARLSLAFCVLWFSANYFAMACLRYTTVASTTILTSTSGVWTLLIGAFTGTENFTWRKLFGVFASLGGIILISCADLSTPNSPSPPDFANLEPKAMQEFPDKPASELALGDTLALLSALLYGFYTITLKRTSLRAAPLQLNMPLFFGLVGIFNFVLLFPLFPVLHFTGLEPFELPPTQRIWTILLVNSVSSLLSDIMWAYAMVLTSPLVVTVGLSLTIPLSLVGEMLVQGRYEGWVYWAGACIIVASFVFVDREERVDEAVERAELGVGTSSNGPDAVLRDTSEAPVVGSRDDHDDDLEDDLLVDR